jgi:hypothetical protein
MSPRRTHISHRLADRAPDRRRGRCAGRASPLHAGWVVRTLTLRRRLLVGAHKLDADVLEKTDALPMWIAVVSQRHCAWHDVRRLAYRAHDGEQADPLAAVRGGELMDRRAVFFLCSALVCAVLAAVTPTELRWVVYVMAIAYTALAAASWLDHASRRRSNP